MEKNKHPMRIVVGEAPKGTSSKVLMKTTSWEIMMTRLEKKRCEKEKLIAFLEANKGYVNYGLFKKIHLLVDSVAIESAQRNYCPIANETIRTQRDIEKYPTGSGN